MEYKKYFKLSTAFEEALCRYIHTNDAPYDDSYYQAKSFLHEIDKKAYKDEKFCESAGKWLKNRGTLRLMKLLKSTGYDSGDSVHFNAFALMDSTTLRK